MMVTALAEPQTTTAVAIPISASVNPNLDSCIGFAETLSIGVISIGLE
jgi:hypothetical protein